MRYLHQHYLCLDDIHIEDIIVVVYRTDKKNLVSIFPKKSLCLPNDFPNGSLEVFLVKCRSIETGLDCFVDLEQINKDS